ncbi:hypothetical protein LOY70_29285 [Pseudomonas sp. B21-054]|uniref:hypothetical protein n=1 Tax=Pseudomonas sp. B21-054 TaxID=2895494 RepID=UPI0022327539|nr:hypothetical protein [Pseudomonas sp. B21-054]UZE17893.1 hypothetical protein LOY70_29285 [Pseudomonas sp. B21-054]
MSSAQVLFQMWEPYRQSLIGQHNFYIQQARERLLSQFADMTQDADRAADAWLDERSKNFDPDRDDVGAIYEASEEAGTEFYLLLDEMRMQTRLSVVAGMFHNWEKKLRGWITDEMRHWHRGPAAPAKVWSADFPSIMLLLESLGWPVSTQRYWQTLNGCRCLVNVYKHGDGKALADLKQQCPEYLSDPIRSEHGLPAATLDWLDHTHLTVSDDQIEGISDAIVAFWSEVPENIFDHDDLNPPTWFLKALKQDDGPGA